VDNEEVKEVKAETVRLALMETIAVVLYVVPQIGCFYLFSRLFSA
jgi:uncharacterized membrane protein YqjE